VLVERGGNAEDDGIGLGDERKIGASAEFASSEGLGDLLGRDVLDVGTTSEEGIGLGGIDIQSDDSVTLAGVCEEQGEADVAEPNNSDGFHEGVSVMGRIVSGHASALG
jgi:hypothetical protein